MSFLLVAFASACTCVLGVLDILDTEEPAMPHMDILAGTPSAGCRDCPRVAVESSTVAAPASGWKPRQQAQHPASMVQAVFRCKGYTADAAKDPIGSGNEGKIYEVKETDNKVMKVFPDSGDLEIGAGVDTECRIMEALYPKLNHPDRNQRVPQCFGECSPNFVMDLIKKPVKFSERIQQVEHKARACGGVIDLMTGMINAGFVDTDKGSDGANILIDEDENVWLIDFSEAKRVETHMGDNLDIGSPRDVEVSSQQHSFGSFGGNSGGEDEGGIDSMLESLAQIMKNMCQQHIEGQSSQGLVCNKLTGEFQTKCQNRFTAIELH